MTFSIPRHLRDARFDAALFALLKIEYPEAQPLSRGFVSRAIRAGRAFLNGAKAKPSVLVDFEDTVEIEKELLAFDELRFELQPNKDVEVEILFEDERLLAISKPGGLQTHPAGRHTDDTLANWIVASYPALQGVGDHLLRPGIVHRLDRETSGAMVIAKTDESFRQLKKIFQERLAEKTYVALTYGHFASAEGIIDKPLVQKSGELKRRVAGEKDSTGDAADENIREAVTRYRVIARYRDFDLVLVTPRTGRTHQIRVHLASIGHPVVGDKLYAFKSMRAGRALFPKRHLLHAWRLRFALSKQAYAFEAPLPPDFLQTLRDIDPITYFDKETYQSLVGSREATSSEDEQKSKNLPE